MKKYLISIPAILLSTLSFGVLADEGDSESFREKVEQLSWDCKIDDNSYFYQGVDKEGEDQRVIHTIVYDGETICVTDDPTNLCNTIVVTKKPWAYKKGVLVDNAKGNNLYRICRTDRDSVPGAYDDLFEVSN